jgi:hypothetical protein
VEFQGKAIFKTFFPRKIPIFSDIFVEKGTKTLSLILSAQTREIQKSTLLFF